MALVPVDAGIRLKLQTEAELVQPLRPAHAIPSELPELVPGQTFTARIQEALPENTYRALVAGKQLTLELPEGAKPGDELELVVIDRSPKVVIARRLEGGSSATPEASVYPWLRMSPAARLIGELLPSEGQKAPPAPLAEGRPLLPAPPAAGQNLSAWFAPRLAQMVSQSGLFYEAHQAQWLRGERPLADLLAEPQGRLSQPAAFLHARAETAAGNAAATAMPTPAATQALEESPKVGAGGTAGAESTAVSRAFPPPLPEPLRPLVAQQLEALATQRLVWEGVFWPGLSGRWEIDWPEERAGSGESPDGSEREWHTRLALSLPALGEIEARLSLAGDAVRLALASHDPAIAARLTTALPELSAAFAAAGLRLQSTPVAVHERA